MISSRAFQKKPLPNLLVSHPSSPTPPPPPPLRPFSSTLPPSTPTNTPYMLTHKDWLSPNQVLKIFETLPRPASVLSVWDQYSKRKDYKPNEAILTLVITKLAQTRNFDAIDGIMRTIKLDHPCRLSDAFFYNVIKAYGSLGGRIKRAIEILLDMPTGYGCWPGVKTFNFVLNLLVSARLFDEAREVYLKAPILGVEIDACCLNILIKGLCNSGDFAGAYKVFDEFPPQRCLQNARTYSTMMHGLCERGRLEEALGLFRRMEGEGIEPDTITFNVLISGLRKNGRVREGMEMLERMGVKGCEPNAGSYLEVLYGLIDVGRFSEAKEFMGRMLLKQHMPSFVAYKKLISGLCKEDLVDDVYWVLKQMVKQGFVPKMGMWTQIVQCMVSRNDAFDDYSLMKVKP